MKPVLTPLLLFADVSKSTPDIHPLNSGVKASKPKKKRTFIKSPLLFWYKYHPLTPPSATPAIIYLERKKYITRIGITVVKSPQ